MFSEIKPFLTKKFAGRKNFVSVEKFEIFNL